MQQGVISAGEVSLMASNSFVSVGDILHRCQCLEAVLPGTRPRSCGTNPVNTHAAIVDIMIHAGLQNRTQNNSQRHLGGLPMNSPELIDKTSTGVPETICRTLCFAQRSALGLQDSYLTTTIVMITGSSTCARYVAQVLPCQAGLF